jgi:hypothetical protein
MSGLALPLGAATNSPWTVTPSVAVRVTGAARAADAHRSEANRMTRIEDDLRIGVPRL